MCNISSHIEQRPCGEGSTPIGVGKARKANCPRVTGAYDGLTRGYHLQPL